jgi:arylformamidase
VAHTIDVFPSRVPAPLHVFFHGGYWQALGKGDSSFPAPHLVAAGVGYAAVDYTLAPAASLDAIVEECRRALCHLWAARNRLGVGAHGVVLAGHSAGAHLVAMLLTTDWQALGVDPGFIKGALLIGGIFDLEPIRQSYVNDALGLDAASARRNSPVHQTPRVDCPLVVTWGEHETLEFKRQSCDFASVWSRHLPRVATFELEGVNHFDALFGWCLPTSRLFRETMHLLRG